MIVPSMRLVALTALLAPLGLVPALAPGFGFAAGAIAVGLLGGVIADLLVSKRRAEVTVSTPPVVRATLNRPVDILVTIGRGKSGIHALDLLLDFPSGLSSEQERQRVLCDDPARAVALVWRAVAHRRGRFPLTLSALTWSSRMGFWEFRSRLPLRTEVRVYPDLSAEQRGMAQFFLQRLTPGSTARRGAGQGSEFEELRDYVPGDAIDRIHWKATARRNSPMTKLFQIERTQEVYVVLDISRLSSIPVARPVEQYTREPLLEAYLRTALTTFLAARRQGDRLGLCVFGSSVKTFLPAKQGKGHYETCCDQVAMLHPEVGSPDYRELGTVLAERIRKRALLIVLTNLDDPVLAEEFAKAVELVDRKHLVLVVNVDARATRPLFADASAESVAEIYESLAGHFVGQRLRILERHLRKRGVLLLRPSPANLSLEVITRYVQARETQRL